MVAGVGLKISGISKTFRQVTAVDHVSVDVQPGVTGILGHNGAGKSTLINVLCGFLRPDSGSVTIDGEPSGRCIPRHLVGHVPQRAGFIPRFTAQEMVQYAAWLRRIPSERISGVAQEALEEVGLWDRRDSQMKRLSGGMAQRVAIACALVHKPKVLLLDEPSNGLDIEQRQAFRRVVQGLDPATVTIISSHLAEDLALLCQNVIIMQQGRVVYSGGMSQLLGDSQDPTGLDLERAFLKVLRR